MPVADPSLQGTLVRLWTSWAAAAANRPKNFQRFNELLVLAGPGVLWNLYPGGSKDLFGKDHDFRDL